MSERRRIKGRFAAIRVGLLDHLSTISPMESKVYLTAHLLATQVGEDTGKVFSNISELSRLTGQKRETVRRALAGLELKGYLEAIEGGWGILNFNGDRPGMTHEEAGALTEKGRPGLLRVADNQPVAEKRPCPKIGQKVAKKRSRGGRKTVSKVAEKRPGRDRKRQKVKAPKPPLEVRRDKEEERSRCAPRTDRRPPEVEGTCLWLHEDENDPGALHLDDEFKRNLHAHLQEVAAQMVKASGGPLVTLTRDEYDNVRRKISDICLKDTRIRATEKSKLSQRRRFKTFCVNRFVDELTYKRQRIARRGELARASPREPRSYATLRHFTEGNPVLQEGDSNGDG